jgi:hypothetical protein
MSVVACPKCAEKVTLPPKTPPAAKVRCPLCGEHYLLEEAMSSMPPMLEVLELPEGYQPATDVDISTAAFLATADRPAVLDDDGGELKLEAPEGGVAVADDELKPLYDEWGPTRSTAPIHETDTVLTPRELVQTPVRRKKKQVNPLFHMLGTVLGGVLAIPVALMILLWLPGSWRRDIVPIGPWLGEHAPFLAPADFRKDSSETPIDDTSAPADDKTSVATKKPVTQESDGGLGGDFVPASKSGLQGNQFDEELKKGFSLDAEDARAKSQGKKPQRAIDDLTDPIIDDTKPELTPEAEPELKPELKPESKPEAKPAVDPDDAKPESKPEPESKPKPEAKPDSEPAPVPDPAPKPDPEPKPEPDPEPKPDPDPDPKPDPEATHEPKLEIEPQVNFELPTPSRPRAVVDPLAPQRLAVTDANEAFDAATTPAEKKAAAIVLYHAAAELAEQLPSDATSAGDWEALTGDAKKLQFVGIYAATWQENGERATPGIVLSGTVKHCQRAGERFEVRIELPSRDKRELLLITADECQAGQKLFVAGRFVMNARDMISGYSGYATMAIDARVLKVVE